MHYDLMTFTYKQPHQKPKRGALLWHSLDEALDVVDSLTVAFYDAIEPLECTFNGYYTLSGERIPLNEQQELLYRTVWRKMSGEMNVNQEAERLGALYHWNEKECGQFQDVLFVYDDDEKELIATITRHGNGVVTVKIDGLKQYDTERSLKRRCFLHWLIVTFWRSKGVIKRLHLAADFKNALPLLCGRSMIKQDGFVIYDKTLKNALPLPYPLVRVERTLNEVNYAFNDGRELVDKIMRQWFKYFELSDEVVKQLQPNSEGL